MRQDRTPKPRPPGFRNNVGLNRDNRDSGGGQGGQGGGYGGGQGGQGGGGMGGRPQFNSFRSQRAPDGRSQGSRPPQPKRRAVPKPLPIAKVPDRWKERRAMLKAAAWRFAKMVHQTPAMVVATEDPYSLIRVPDIKARQLAKKIIRLRRTRKPPASPPVAKREKELSDS